MSFSHSVNEPTHRDEVGKRLREGPTGMNQEAAREAAVTALELLLNSGNFGDYVTASVSGHGNADGYAPGIGICTVWVQGCKKPEAS